MRVRVANLVLEEIADVRVLRGDDPRSIELDVTTVGGEESIRLLLDESETRELAHVMLATIEMNRKQG